MILAERDKVEMEDLIRSKIADLRNTRVICRTGSPIDLDDLRIVKPNEARSVVVLAEEGIDADTQVIKSVLALTQGLERRAEPYHIIAVIHDPANLEASRLVGNGETVFIDKRETISRLIVQSSRQSGASVVYTELLDFEGDEVYFRRDESLVGKTFGEALFAYEDCTIIGLHRGGDVVLNPPMETTIGAEDSIVAIAEDDSRLAAAVAYGGAIDEAVIAAPTPIEEPTQRVLLLGWNSRSAAVINELDQYAREGSLITVVADDARAQAAIAAQCGGVRNLTIAFREGSTTDRRTLDGLGVPGYDQVIVMCYSEQLAPQHADARTLVTLLHLRDIAARAGAYFPIASEMLDDRNRELAQVTKVDDVIVSDRLISLMIAQISENPHLGEVFSKLFAAEGSEIYLRPVEEYLANGRPAPFATLVEAARRRGEIAIGYRDKSSSTDAAGRLRGASEHPEVRVDHAR